MHTLEVRWFEIREVYVNVFSLPHGLWTTTKDEIIGNAIGEEYLDMDPEWLSLHRTDIL